MTFESSSPRVDFLFQTFYGIDLRVLSGPGVGPCVGPGVTVTGLCVLRLLEVELVLGVVKLLLVVGVVELLVLVEVELEGVDDVAVEAGEEVELLIVVGKQCCLFTAGHSSVRFAGSET